MSPVFLIACSFLMLLLGLLAAYGVARLATVGSGRLARRYGVLSHVTGRSSHRVPTPRLGGLGLVAGFVCGAGLFLGGLWLLPHGEALIGFNPRLLAWVGLGFALMVAVGLLDDLYDLNPVLKLILMALACLPPVIGGGLVFELSMALVPAVAAQAGAIALAFVWILFFTNAFNFMDGMDGFAAGFARQACLFLFAVPFLNGLLGNSLLMVRGEVYLLPILAMACAGFLRYNRPPARIFMGDGGSLGLGYLLAVIVLLGSRSQFGLPVTATTSLTILMPFLFDVILTLIRRSRRRCNLFQAHCEHLYQRLLQTGQSHADVLKTNEIRFLICGFSGLLGGVFQGWLWRWGCLGLALGVMIDYWIMVLREETRASGKPF